MTDVGTHTPLLVRLCCGDPGDCSQPCEAEPCVCAPEFLEHDISDIRCPQHGLEPFLRKVLAP